MHVFITGGTGLVGPRLIRQLRKRGDAVTVLSRQADAWQRVGQDCAIVVGDPTVAGDWQDKAAECDAVINLAGENIFAKRWNSAFKQQIRDSRVKATDNVVAALAKNPKRADGSPKVLVNASAIGYYGPRGGEEIDESSPPGTDVMARVCQDWEKAAESAEQAGARAAWVRIGIVHDALGGALQKLWLPFRFGAGGPVVSVLPFNWGGQYWSWIHHADLCGLFLLALDHADARGPINGTAPNPVTNKDFGEAFAAALGWPKLLGVQIGGVAPTPALGLRVLLGEVSEILTSGARVVPKKALQLGYQFQYPELGPALRDIVRESAAA